MENNQMENQNVVAEAIAAETDESAAVIEEIVAEEAVAEETVAEAVVEEIADEETVEEAVAEEVAVEETAAEEAVVEEAAAEEKPLTPAQVMYAQDDEPTAPELVKGKKSIGGIIGKCFVVLLLVAAYGIMIYQKVTNPEISFIDTYWALLPPLTAIGLALLTKEVYSSLFLGIVSGALLYNNFNLPKSVVTVFSDGIIANIADEWNAGILVFLVTLGIIVALVNSAGGSLAYGKWASKRIGSRKGAMFATFGLGVLIFIDDYFNCLTVGSVMRPLTDKQRISRAKLAYLIDATAAPICMIAPISSWAAAVAGVVEGEDGLVLFCRAIPYNFYSLLTIAMIVFTIIIGLDFGIMKKNEINAINGDLYTTEARPYEGAEEEEVNERGRVIDLILPVIVLIVSCVIGMIYTGGFFGGESFINSFANSDASVGLALGSTVALLIIFVYLAIRRLLPFSDMMSCIPKGFKAMVPAIMILVFAWTLGGLTKSLGAQNYFSTVFENSSATLNALVPALVFIVAIVLSFATGTSWGTFAILLPIVVSLGLPGELMIMGISACLAGAVCGDHCSPISDTTIMSSTGAQCDHINHVSTQIPYAMLVAGVSLVSYIIAGFINNVWISLPIALALMIGVLLLIKVCQRTSVTEAAEKAANQ